MRNRGDNFYLKCICSLLAIGILASGGCAAIITNRGPRVNVEPRPDQLGFSRLAVLPFASPPGAPDAGWVAADAFARRLIADNKYDVIRKDLVEAVLGEAKVDPIAGAEASALRDVGRRLGAEAVLIGAVNRYERYNKSALTEDYHGAMVSLSAQLINVQDGTILWDVAQALQAERNVWTGEMPPTLERLTEMAVAEMALTLEVVLEKAQRGS